MYYTAAQQERHAEKVLTTVVNERIQRSENTKPEGVREREENGGVARIPWQQASDQYQREWGREGDRGSGGGVARIHTLETSARSISEWGREGVGERGRQGEGGGSHTYPGNKRSINIDAFDAFSVKCLCKFNCKLSRIATNVQHLCAVGL